MPTTTSITTTYAGEFAGKYVSAALLSAPTIENGGIEVKPNVKFKEVLKKLNTTGLIADGSCDFTPTDTITLTERILQPEEFQVNVQLCKKDFRSDWEAISMGYSAFDVLPKTFTDYLIAYMVGKIAEKNEQNIWNGVTANAGEFDGFATRLAVETALPAAQEVAGVAITSSNVITELGKIVDAIPSTLYGKDDLFIYVPQNIFRAYVRSLGGFASRTLQNVAGTENVSITDIGGNGVDGKGTMWYGGGSLMFDGVKMFMANGLPANKAIATTKDNLFFGTGLLSDHNEVKVIDMADVDGSQNVRFVMRFTANVQYANPEDIVTYGIPNAVN